MSLLKKHIFVCENQREANHPKGCCADKGGREIKNALKMELVKNGLNKVYRSNSAGCLDVCEHGAAMVIYPQNIWYGNVQLSDIPEIVKYSILGNKIINRLLITTKLKQSSEND